MTRGKDLNHYAQANAEADNLLFDTLFAPKSPMGVDKIARCVQIVEQNIREILDIVCRVFGDLTKDVCSASVKVIERAAYVKNEDVHLMTIARDSSSGMHVDRREYARFSDRVSSNTMFEEIFVNLKRAMFINDLDALFRRGLYKNARSDWKLHYNAVLILAIPSIQGADRDALPLGILAVDNHRGGFTEAALQRAEEFVWRIAVMLDRLGKLERMAQSPI